MTSIFLNRSCGVAIIMAGITWGAGFLVMTASSSDSPLNLAAGISAVIVALVLAAIGFSGIGLHAHRVGRVNRERDFVWLPVVLGSIALIATAINLLAHDSGPAWNAFMCGLILFVGGLGIGTVTLVVSNILPRWSTVPLVLVAAFTAAAWIVGQPLLNLVTFPSVAWIVIEVAIGGTLVLVGSGLATVRPDAIYSPTVYHDDSVPCPTGQSMYSTVSKG